MHDRCNRHSHGCKKKLSDNTGKLLIHEFRNFVHQINMELDQAERGLEEKFKYADLISTVDSMTRSLEDLRARLLRIRKIVRTKKYVGWSVYGRCCNLVRR